jgi:2-polyprenyl-3-methyl-5-hydroxy-6-metoxy-1,4-benzoquinol methylase
MENESSDVERDRLSQLWHERSEQHGSRSVFNLNHEPSSLAHIDSRQKKIIYDVLRKVINGNENAVLDFGCGSGRFTKDLSALVGEGIEIVGFDLCENLLKIARQSAPDATFISTYSTLLSNKYVGYFGLILSITVMGGLSDSLCIETASVLSKICQPGGLILLAENTAEAIRGDKFWTFRPLGYYRSAFRHFDLHLIRKYWDLGNEVSIMIGVKQSSGQ